MSDNAKHVTAGAPLAAHELTASLTVADLEHSLRWYRDALGFEIDRTHERGNRVIAVSLKAGAVRILLTHDDGQRGTDRLKGTGFSLQLSTTQSADERADRVRQYGTVLDTEPTDTPWGPRIFRVRDPDGFRWTISSTHGSAV